MTATITSEIIPWGPNLAGEPGNRLRLDLDLWLFSDDSEGKRVKRVCAFWDERYCKNRSITDIDWSPKVWFIYLNVLCCHLIVACLPQVPRAQRRVLQQKRGRFE